MAGSPNAVLGFFARLFSSSFYTLFMAVVDSYVVQFKARTDKQVTDPVLRDSKNAAVDAFAAELKNEIALRLNQPVSTSPAPSVLVSPNP